MVKKRILTSQLIGVITNLSPTRINKKKIYINLIQSLTQDILLTCNLTSLFYILIKLSFLFFSSCSFVTYFSQAMNGDFFVILNLESLICIFFSFIFLLNKMVLS